jgi:hypothetical protein
MRNFNEKAKRDGLNGKLHPYGFSHPLCDHVFNKYMDYHREQADGQLREPDNWWGGWDRKISLDSLARHVEDLKCLHAGYMVYKQKVDNGEITHVVKKGFKPEKGWKEVTEAETVCAIRFNSMAYLLEILK